MTVRRVEDVPAEQAFLGSLLVRPSVVAAAGAQITPVMMSRDAHRVIYQAILEVGVGADTVTVCHWLTQAGKLEDVGGSTYIVSLPNMTPAAENWEFYAEVIRETYLQRCLQSLAPKLQVLAQSKPAEAFVEIRAQLREIEKSLPQRPRVVALEDCVPAVWDDIERRASNEDLPGIPYGFPTIDRATGGQYPGEFVLVTGITGTGKSAVVLHLWERAGRRGPALLCSNEMRVLQNVQRVLARRARVDVTNLRNPRALTLDEEQRLSRAMGEVTELRNRYFLSDATFTVDMIRAAVEDVRERAGSIAWVAIDWLQLLRGDHARGREGRVAELDGIVQEIQELAAAYAVPVVVVSQYDKVASRTGDLSPLGSRGSGMIAYAASVAIAIEYDDDNQTALQRNGRLVITKSRMGPRVEEPVIFEGAFVNFRPRDVRHAEPAWQSP